ncbi:MAG: hypothetical protein II844_00220 [Prevotella sp.]|nr:hypothetical protein [Prevotella sp.]
MRYIAPYMLHRIHIFFVTLMMLCCFGSGVQTISAQHGVGRDRDAGSESCIDNIPQHPLMANEQRRTLGDATVRPQSQHRLTTEDSTRIIPSHGGKPGRPHVCAYKNHWYNLSRFFHTLTLGRQMPQCAASASPRLLYVIALRRLLC